MNTSSVSIHYDLVVVGAGPAGMMAAGRAAALGARILLLEKGDSLGRKLAIAGGGRGNFTHAASRTDLGNAFFGKTPKRFLQPAFSAFDADALRLFFSDLGVPSTVEAGGKVYPVSGRAIDLLEALKKFCLVQSVSIQLHAAVQELSWQEADGVFCLKISPSEKCSLDVVFAKRVLLCTGGKTFPHTGSNGDGYFLASSLGHTITALGAALQAINLDEPLFSALSGLSLLDVCLKLSVAEGSASSQGIGKRTEKSRGELLFTHFGLSGPAALHLSRFLDSEADALHLDLLPDISEESLMQDLLAFSKLEARRPASAFFSDRLPQRLADALSTLVWRDGGDRKTAAHLTKQERLQIVGLLKNLPLRLAKLRPFEQGMVTRGGVALNEVSGKTMQSRLHPGLFFAGEILDIDGPSGGYNLQAAFSTGYLAAVNAVASLSLNEVPPY